MFSNLNARCAKRFGKSIIKTIFQKSKKSHSSFIPILTNFDSSKSNSKHKLILAGVGLTALLDAKDEKNVIAPSPVTTDPTKKEEKKEGSAFDWEPVKPSTKKSGVKKSDPNALRNPGPYDNYDKEAKALLEHFSAMMGGHLQILAHYIEQEKKTKQGELVIEISASPVIQRYFHASGLAVTAQLGNDYALTGKVSGSGRVEGSAQILKTGFAGFSVTPRFKINPGNSQYNSLSLDVNQKGYGYHLSSSIESKAVTVSYMQSLWKDPDLIVGLQFTSGLPLATSPSLLIPVLVYRNMTDVPGRTSNPNPNPNAPREETGDIYTGQYISSQSAWLLSYARKEGRQLTFATQLIFSAQTHESNWSGGVKFDVEKFVYQAKVASDWTVTVGCDYIVAPNIKLGLSAELNHGQQNQPPAFGVSLTLLV